MSTGWVLPVRRHHGGLVAGEVAEQIAPQTVWSPPGETYVHIVDFADVDNSLALLPPGNSENPDSPHFNDQIDIWEKGELRPAPISREAVEKIRESSRIISL